MNQILSAKVLSSLKEFVNYRLTKDTAAYSNQTVTLYNYSDKVLTGKYVYGSAYPSWGYNLGVSGPTYCSGVNNPGFTNKGTGLYIDYRNGRVISNSAITGTITANVAVMDINSYVTTYSSSRLINETQFTTPPTNYSVTGAAAPYSYHTSAIFFRLNGSDSEELSFGGQDWSIFNIKVTSLAKTNAHSMVVSHIIRDLNRRNFPLLDVTPLNEYGDLKSGWSYTGYLATGQQAYITDTNFGFVDNDVFGQNNPNIEVAIGNIEVRVPRNPRSEYQ